MLLVYCGGIAEFGMLVMQVYVHGVAEQNLKCRLALHTLE